MNIEELTTAVMKQAEEKGFGTKLDEISVPEKISLIHAQVSSAYEGYRKKQIDGPYSFSNEMAGALQRIVHLCAVMDIDVEKALKEKFEENADREWDWENLNEKHS